MRHRPVLTMLARTFAVVGLVAVAVIVDYRDMIALFTLPFGLTQEQAQGSAPVEPAPLLAFDEVSDKRRYTVTVQCDESSSEIGRQLVQRLEANGFDVRQVDEWDIPRTLVVFGKPSEQAAAESIVRTLGFGKAIGGREGYSYEGDILVLVGSDASAAALPEQPSA